MGKYDLTHIKKTLRKIERYTGGTDKKQDIINKLSYNFGVDPKNYSFNMSKKELIELTHKKQSLSQLTKDLNNEIKSLL